MDNPNEVCTLIKRRLKTMSYVDEVLERVREKMRLNRNSFRQ